MKLRHIIPLIFLAIPCSAPAGNILYEFDDAHYPHAAIARMEVAEAALGRGYFTNSDLRAFAFNLFGTADLDPFMLPISADGSAAGAGMIFGQEIVYGSTYRLTLDFGGELGGFYQVTTGNYPGVYGYGYWTAILIPAASAAVPEPTSLALAGLAFAIIFLTRRSIR